MLYFDKSYLKDYIKSGLKLKVYVNGDYLTIADSDDLKNATGEGMSSNGEMKTFNYKDVDHVKVGSRIFTMKDLNGENDADQPNNLDDKV